MNWSLSPDNYRRNVTDAAAWADAHSGLVQFIFDEFKRTGAWPELDTLQRDLDRRDAGIDVERELREMPPSLGGGGYPDPVSLCLRGLSHVADAEPLLSGYMRLVQLAVERYRGDDPSPTITDQDVRELGFDAPAALLVSQIVFRESWPFGGGSGYPAGPWAREVGRDVRYVQGAGTIGDYLDVQAALRYGPPPDSASGDSEPAGPTRRAEQHPSPPDPGRQAPRRGSPLFQTAVEPTPPPAQKASPSANPVQEHASTQSTRRARASPVLTDDVFIRLVFKALAKAASEGLHMEAFEEGPDAEFRDGRRFPSPPLIRDPEQWLMMSLARSGLWAALRDPEATAKESTAVPRVWLDDRDLVLASIHRDVGWFCPVSVLN